MIDPTFLPQDQCYLWRSELLLWHGISDGVIALAHYSIAICIAYVVQQRKDLPFRSIFLLFVAFIITCGTIHLLAIWTLWQPNYGLAGLLKILTAILSLVTAIAFLSLIPEAMGAPSPKQLSEANRKLAIEIQEREQIQQKLRQHKNFLDRIYTGIMSAIFVLEPDSNDQFRYIGANPYFSWITGLDVEQINGKSLFELVPPFSFSQVRHLIENLQICTSQYQAIQYEEIMQIQGQETWWLTTLSPELREGKVSRVIGTSVNVTEQKKLESALRVQVDKAIESAHTKSVLLKEIHHRTKNNLQLISGLVYLQMQHVKEPETQTVLMDIRNRIQSIALLHEKLYSSEDIDQIPFSDYIKSLARDIILTYTSDPSQVELKVEAEERFLNIDQAVACGLVITEIMINALKHAFPQGQSGAITIQFFANQDHGVELRIGDNGVGLDPETLKRGSFGLRLVNSLVTRQLQGSLAVNPDGGTQFIIQFRAK